MSDRHILIADPDPVQRQLIDMLLADERTEIVSCDSARSVLEHVRASTPSLILMANELPDLPGIAVCKRIKSVQRLARVPIIVTTAEPEGLGIDQDLRRSADEAGVDLLLPKPLGDKALKERSRRLLAAAEAGVTSQRRPAPKQLSTAVIEQTLRELDDAVTEPESASTPSVTTPSATTPEPDIAEVMKELLSLRDENGMLKHRVATQQQTIDTLKAELDGLKRASRNRGLFGRRK